MTRVRLSVLLGTLLLMPIAAWAQSPAPADPRQPPAAAPAAPAAPETGPPRPRDPLADLRDLDPSFRYGNNRGILRIGTDFVLPADGDVNQLTVIGANALLEGTVDRDVLVVFGDAEVGPNAVIRGTLTVVSGAVRIREGASIRRDLLVVGGTFDAPPNFAPGGDHVVIDSRAFGGRAAALLDWIVKGLLWGRLIVPSLTWMWPIVLLWIGLTLVLSLLLERPVAAAVEALSARPLTCAMVGLLVLLLVGPASVLLAVSLIGIAVIPFVICGLILALVIGKLAVTRRLGRGILPEAEEASRTTALRSTAIGLALLTVAYMVPVAGLLVWTLAGVFGVGASALAFFAAYRRENPTPIAAVTPPPPIAPAPDPVLAVPAFRARTSESAASTEPVEERSDIPIPPPPPPRFLTEPILSFPRASFRDRLLAGVLDLILLAVLVNVVDPFIRDNAIVLVGLAYFIGFWAWKGTTVGGIILQLRVIRVDGSKVGFPEALVRGLSSVFSAIVLGIGFLWILRDPERQAWQDRIAGTYVVKVPRDWPL